ncbi:Acyl-CoA N-acyltransferase [Beauveria bassiana ARSEF 2860]|uniref:Acyl-CoA N-acyltransferase n=1 Tax=Beauveria bassiana (strain ARSEF 2860) TaxID=655819 RepID=J5JRR4_BEAB2|nr:Acyl-CoA N-acyltransferase [Beauveria bassiana ARSEF 2860]EJP65431.1 Acyl-CoA N-acyltransferase [Beauveria bassiana ARSEF 2860]
MSTTQTQMAPSELTAAANEPEIPLLTYTIAQTAEEKRNALRLVADTIAQQRQVASTTVIFHPATLGPFVAVLAGLVYRRSGSDWVGAVILASGVIVAYLAAIQYYTYDYLSRAERFNWKSFITPPSSASEPAQQQDTVMYARYGDHVIATLVLRLVEAKIQTPSKMASQQRGTGSSAQVRAWATRLRYRDTGVGGDMLREAVAFARSSLGPAAAIAFSDSHAHAVDATRHFTAPFARREKRARQALAQAIKDVDAAAER